MPPTIASTALTNLVDLAKSYNGYEREFALHELRRAGNLEILPTLLERVNDWVPAVKNLAQDMLLELLDKNPDAFITSLPDIFHLRKRARYDHNVLISKILTVLLESHKPKLLAAINGKDRKAALIAYRLSIEYQLANKMSLIELGLLAKDILMSRSAGALLDQLSDQEFIEISPLVISHCSGALKVKGIKRLDTLEPERIRAIADTILFSTSEELRKIAHKHLAMGHAKRLSFYQNATAKSDISQTKLSVCISEVADLMKAESLSFLYEYAKHPAPKIRKLALQKITKFEADDDKFSLINGILDEAPLVSREATRLCYKYKSPFTGEELLEVSRQVPSGKIIDSILLLAKKSGKWSRLLICLHLIAEYKNNDSICRRLNSELDHWISVFNLSGSAPSRAQIDQIRLLLNSTGLKLKGKHFTYLQFTLNTM